MAASDPERQRVGDDEENGLRSDQRIDPHESTDDSHPAPARQAANAAVDEDQRSQVEHGCEGHLGEPVGRHLHLDRVGDPENPGQNADLQPEHGSADPVDEDTGQRQDQDGGHVDHAFATNVQDVGDGVFECKEQGIAGRVVQLDMAVWAKVPPAREEIHCRRLVEAQVVVVTGGRTKRARGARHHNAHHKGSEGEQREFDHPRVSGKPQERGVETPRLDARPRLVSPL